MQSNAAMKKYYEDNQADIEAMFAKSANNITPPNNEFEANRPQVFFSNIPEEQLQTKDPFKIAQLLTQYLKKSQAGGFKNQVGKLSPTTWKYMKYMGDKNMPFNLRDALILSTQGKSIRDLQAKIQQYIRGDARVYPPTQTSSWSFGNKPNVPLIDASRQVRDLQQQQQENQGGRLPASMGLLSSDQYNPFFNIPQQNYGKTFTGNSQLENIATVNMIDRSQVDQLLQRTALSNPKNNSLASFMVKNGLNSQALKKRTDLKKSVAQQAKNFNAPRFKNAQAVLGSMIRFEDGKWKFDGGGKGIGTLVGSSKPDVAIYNRGIRGQAILSTKLDYATTLTQVPQLVRNIIDADKEFSKSGIGPIKKGGLQLYAGRYLSPTGYVRTLPNATSKFINPLDWYQKINYLQARVLNKWNSYVRTSEELDTLITKNDPQKYHQTQVDILKGQLDSPANELTALLWIRNQLAKQELGLPVDKSTAIVSKELSQDDVKQIIQIVNIFYKQSGKPTIKTFDADPGNATRAKAARKSVNKILSKAFDSVAPPDGDNANNPLLVKQYARKAAAFAQYWNKGVSSTLRAVKKLQKTLIPANMTTQKAEQMNQKLNKAADIMKTMTHKQLMSQQNKRKLMQSLTSISQNRTKVKNVDSGYKSSIEQLVSTINKGKQTKLPQMPTLPNVNLSYLQQGQTRS